MCHLSLSGIPGALVYRLASEDLNLDSPLCPLSASQTFCCWLQQEADTWEVLTFPSY